MQSNINSDHYPMKTRIIMNLKTKYTKDVKTYEYDECTQNQRETYNEAIKEQLQNPGIDNRDTMKVVRKIIQTSAEQNIPKREKSKNVKI